jgi:hypothetical protein
MNTEREELLAKELHGAVDCVYMDESARRELHAAIDKTIAARLPDAQSNTSWDDYNAAYMDGLLAGSLSAKADAQPVAQCVQGLPDWDFQSMDAKVWTDAFIARYPHMDWGVMIGWFANAMMAAFDEATRRASPQPAVPECVWTLKPDARDYETSCGAETYAPKGRYCNLCGGKIAAAPKEPT